MDIIKFENRDEWLSLRLKDITSTEVSALFNLNPWITEFELWHQKKQQELVAFNENERMTWGKRLEAAIAEGFAEEYDWNVEPFKDYARIPELRAGSSFDYRIKIEDNEFNLLEIKNVDGLQFKNKWVIEEGKVDEAPPHIELQLQHQFLITEYPQGFIGALVGGNSGQALMRKPNPAILKKITEKIEKFWWSIDNDKPPSPDFERDAEFIAELHCSSEPGLIVDASGDLELEQLAYDYKTAGDMARDWEKKKKAAKAEILMKIGESEKVLAEHFSISAKTTSATIVEAYERKAFRNFRITIKKPKQPKEQQK